jgi:hypothetical protein
VEEVVAEFLLKDPNPYASGSRHGFSLSLPLLGKRERREAHFSPCFSESPD